MTELERGLAAFHVKDYAIAFRLLEPIAQQGNAEAQAIMGNFYQLGLGMNPDLDIAAQWYHKSSEQGYGVASNNLAGIALQRGDTAEAERLFRLARQQGFEHAPTSANYLDK